MFKLPPSCPRSVRRSVPRTRERGPLRPHDFDAIDAELLRLLQTDARQSMRTFAKRVGLSRSAVWDRIKRMEIAGLILGYQATIAPSAVASDLDAVVRIKLRADDPTAFRRFDKELRDADFVAHAARISGPGFYQIRAVSRTIVDWLEARAAACGMSIEAFDAVFVTEEIVPQRAAPPKIVLADN